MAEAEDEGLLELLGERLRDLRERKGLTQGEAAAQVGTVVRERPYEYNTVQKIEAGRFKLRTSRENLEAYAKVLGTTLDDLLAAVERELRRRAEGDVLGPPKIPVGFPMVKMRFAGDVPCSAEWGDPLASEEFMEVEAQFEGPRRFIARVVGDSCYPALLPGDLTVWQSDVSPPYGAIVLAQRKGDHGCTVKQLTYDEKAGRPRLKPVNPKAGEPSDGEGWGVVARLVAVLRSSEAPRRTWFWEAGIKPEHLS